MSEPKGPIAIDCGTFGPPEEQVRLAERTIIDCETVDAPEEEIALSEPADRKSLWESQKQKK